MVGMRRCRFAVEERDCDGAEALALRPGRPPKTGVGAKTTTNSRTPATSCVINATPTQQQRRSIPTFGHKNLDILKLRFGSHSR